MQAKLAFKAGLRFAEAAGCRPPKTVLALAALYTSEKLKWVKIDYFFLKFT
jgi:hypothetical protein